VCMFQAHGRALGVFLTPMMGATAVVERMTLTAPPQVPMYLAALASHTPVFVRAWEVPVRSL
jgi:hypothetical protein